jgi:hypothetical protein
MIVVGFVEGSLAFEVARRAAADGGVAAPGTGARVEMVGATGAGPAGDRRLLELAAAGVGHATVIRTGADRLEPADLELALRYLPDIRAIVLVDPEPDLLAVAAAAGDWTGATLVVVGAASLAAHLPSDRTLLLEPPPADPDGTFAGFVAALALRLDAGDDSEAAFRATTHRLAADPVRPL